MTRAAAILAATLAALSLAGVAYAEPSAPGEGRARRLVRVVVAGGDEDASMLEPPTRELVGRLGLEVAFERGDAGATARGDDLTLAIVKVDVSRATRTSIVVVDGRDGRVAAERDLPRPASTRVALDEVAHVIQASVEELLDPARVPPTPPPPPPPPSPDPAPRPSSAKISTHFLGLDAGGFLEGRSYGRDAVPVMGGGAMVGVAFGRSRLRPALWASGAYHVPFDVQGERPVGVRQHALGLRLAPTLALVATERFLLEAGADLGADVFFTDARSNDVPSSRLTQGVTRASPIVGGLVALHLSVGSTADLFLAATADVDLAPPSYRVKIGSRTDEIYTAARVRPALALGFTFNVLGASPYAPAREGSP